MRIMIDIGHPAHVHYFRNAINILQNNGHQIFVSARDKEMTHYLLKKYGIDFYNRGKGKNTAVGKILYLFNTDVKLFFFAKKVKPDIFIGFGSPYIAHVAFLTKKPCIILDDTENAKFGQLFYKRFASSILSPSTFDPDFGIKHLKFNSYMELCYLHPNYFKADNEILCKFGIIHGEKYTIVRFVSWLANHDFGHKGLTIDNKIHAVKEFAKYGKVFITSEKQLPEELEHYRLRINPEHIHRLLARASLFYGESATMASESAVLGTPAIYLDSVGRGYTTEQEKKYGLVYNFTESEQGQQASITKGVELLKQGKGIFIERKEKILKDKVDLTALLVWFIENFPESQRILKVDPGYQYRFK